jgi:Chlorophyll A-B binding protein
MLLKIHVTYTAPIFMFFLHIDYAWNLFQPKSADGLAKKKASELLNGRLAMIAIGGIATQSITSGHGFPYI